MKVNKHLKIGFVMDPIPEIGEDDTSVSLMMEAQSRKHRIFYLEPRDIFLTDDTVWGNSREVSVSAKPKFKILRRKRIRLETLDLIFIRKNPPFDISYFYLTHALSLVRPPTKIINRPEGLRAANEKLYILNFPDWIPPTLVSQKADEILKFQDRICSDIILKPLDLMAGKGIRLLPKHSKQKESIARQMTRNDTKWIMAQKFLPTVLKSGDKRILLLNGKPIGQYQKIPRKREFRSNISLGGIPKISELTLQEKKLIRSIRPRLLRDGLLFAGLDVLDGRLIEVNVTSPAGAWEVNLLEGRRIEPLVVDFLERLACWVK